MNNALIHINNMPATKEGINSFVEMAKCEILSGEYDPLKIDIQLKSIEEIIKQLRKDTDVKRCILSEIDKYADKSFDFMSAKITKKNSVSYDFSNDTKWASLNSKIETLKQELKEHEDLLKVLKSPVYSEETGEMLTPPSKQITETYSISFK